MKKKNKFSDLSKLELSNKQKQLMKQLVAFKVSMDPSGITEATGIDGLRKDLRALNRQIAMASAAPQKETVRG